MTSGPILPDPDGRSDEHPVEAEVTTGAGDGGWAGRLGRSRPSTIVVAALVVMAVVAAASILIYRATGEDGDGDSLRTGVAPAAEIPPAGGGDAGDAPPGGSEAQAGGGSESPAGAGTPGGDDGAPDDVVEVPDADGPGDAADGSPGGDDGAPDDVAEVAAPDGHRDDVGGEAQDSDDGAAVAEADTVTTGEPHDAGDDGSGDGDMSGAGAGAGAREPEDCVILVTFDRYVVLVCERIVPGGPDSGVAVAPGETTDGPTGAAGSTPDDPGLAGPSGLDVLADFFGPDGWDPEAWEELFGPDGFGPADGRIGWCEIREPETAEPGVERFEFRCRPSMEDWRQHWESRGPPPAEELRGGDGLPGDLPDDPVAALEETIRQALAEICREGADGSSEDFELLQQACGELLDDAGQDGPGTAAADGSAGAGQAESPDPGDPQAAAPASESLLGSLFGDLFSGGGDGEQGGLGDLFGDLFSGGDGEQGGLGDLFGDLFSGGDGGEAGGLGGLFGDLFSGGDGGEAGGLGGLFGDLFSGADGGEAGVLGDLLASLLFSGGGGGDDGGLGSLFGGLLGSDGSADGLGTGAAGDLLGALVPGLGPLISLAQLLGLLDTG